MTATMKRMLGGLLAATVFASLMSAGNVAQAQERVVFAGWGGSIQAAQRKIYFDAFEKETGIKVIDVPDVNLPKIKAMVDSGDVQWDVTQALGLWIPLGTADKLWEKLDYKVVKADAVAAEFRSEYGIGNSWPTAKSWRTTLRLPERLMRRSRGPTSGTLTESRVRAVSRTRPATHLSSR